MFVVLVCLFVCSTEDWIQGALPLSYILNPFYFLRQGLTKLLRVSASWITEIIDVCQHTQQGFGFFKVINQDVSWKSKMPKMLSFSFGQPRCYQAPWPGLQGEWRSLVIARMCLGSSSTCLFWEAANCTAWFLPVAQLLVCLWNNCHSLLDWEASLGAGDLIRTWKMPLASMKKILKSAGNLRLLS